jgi:hypothetical protein
MSPDDDDILRESQAVPDAELVRRLSRSVRRGRPVGQPV